MVPAGVTKSGSSRWRRRVLLFSIATPASSALAVGGYGAVGSTYNFNAPVHHRIIDAFRAGEMEQARDEQFRSVLTIRTIVKFGFMGGTKGIMEMLGIPVGEPRLPHHSLDAETKQRLRSELEAIGFFDWQ